MDMGLRVDGKCKNPYRLNCFGLIGFGQFGRFTAAALSAYGDVSFFDPHLLDTGSRLARVAPDEGPEQAVSLEVVCSARNVLFCVPLNNLNDCVREASAFIAPSSWVVDLSSVRTVADAAFSRHLPSHRRFIGIHPLFGPNTSYLGVAPLNAAVCTRPGDTTPYHILRFLRRLGMEPTPMTSDSHDRAMAASQAILHFIAYVIRDMDIARQTVVTKSFQEFAKVIASVSKVSSDVYIAIAGRNPYAAEVRLGFIEAAMRQHKILSAATRDESDSVST